MCSANKVRGRSCAANPKSSYIKAFLIVGLLLLTGCQDQIVHNLGEEEANELLTRLHDGSITGEKIRQPDGKWSIAVDRDETLAALKFLSDSRMLRGYGRAPTERSSVVSSREDQRFRFERSLSWEIEQTLSSIDGVLESRVHLNLPATDPLFGQPIKNEPGSASVLVITDRARPEIELQLKSLVAGASGITSERIAVVISPVKGVDATDQALSPGAEVARREKEIEVAATKPDDQYVASDSTIVALPSGDTISAQDTKTVKGQITGVGKDSKQPAGAKQVVVPASAAGGAALSQSEDRGAEALTKTAALPPSSELETLSQASSLPTQSVEAQSAQAQDAPLPNEVDPQPADSASLDLDLTGSVINWRDYLSWFFTVLLLSIGIGGLIKSRRRGAKGELL